ncbi:class I SAM-dependent DNA methyltransferase [Marinivivus vitaminiproducens]|uniref:class I SAM-dependent DNA methyltransferase n=1 Tax=Marinivivus vitaminiproducens TaxID=3035935 RepID=UPI00279DCF11|nr:SAM-dependent methyltransferase [Geminicoccaceae bacterium SCSIO 64248]
MSGRRTLTIGADWFETLYSADPDPWRFHDSPYEQAKYDHTLSALPQARYASALEVGCSVGVLTRRLAERCAALLAVDAAPSAVDRARQVNRDLAHVRVERRVLPGDAPCGRFDLIVLSEVLYYFDAADLQRVCVWVGRRALPDADIVLVHWTGATDYPLSGDDATLRFIEGLAGSVAVTRQERRPAYRLDVLRRAGAADGAPDRSPGEDRRPG